MQRWLPVTTFLYVLCISTAFLAAAEPSAPRKVIVGTVIQSLSGFRNQEQRIQEIEDNLDKLARQAQEKYATPRLDIVILPEEILTLGGGRSPAERAVKLNGPEVQRIRTKASQLRSYVVLPLTLAEEDGTYTNAAVLIDRKGKTTGVYRKFHPVAPYDSDVLEGGITPGSHFPVFDCDFGKVGIQICWDMSYEDGWQALAKQGAELIALPTASPQTVRPAAYALQGRCYVVTATPRNNASIFNPVGKISAQVEAKGVLVHQVDLSYARLHWSPTLRNGKSFSDKYGDRAGYHYYEAEDTGLFWSNDPQTPIAEMVAELGEVEMLTHVERVRRLQDAARAAAGN